MEFRDIVATSGFVTYSLRHPFEALSSFGPTLNEASLGLLGSTFNPTRDIPNLQGKVILVTGGNVGLGKETILQLAQHGPARIYLAARTESKARDAIESIQTQLSSPVDIRFIPLDLCSFKSIRAAAAQFQTDSDQLDTLILNAGTMGNPAGKTEDGFEIQLGTNHVGHFLLTKLLLPTLQKTVARAEAKGTTPDVRIVSLASAGHAVSPVSFEELTSTPSLLEMSTWHRYGASKAANIFFAAELARRYPEILSVSVHPGAVNSDLYSHAKATGTAMKHSLNAVSRLFFRDLTSGALNTLWAASTARTNLVNGAYYTPVGYRSGGTAFVQDAEVARKLWDWTEAQISERS
ncbi:Short-chain dehydrogenase/reductase SDR [Penicillium capsulatum]|uniref:Short-chain dehydrogenase/reductase SDR n=1 Tax=Penicillium capsulatum TaxID=69766 RepID=A0A9W9IMW2_9EURO|nr:Short-chain dehydrogenase/reductase SDR [Penicillium capsulatum]